MIWHFEHVVRSVGPIEDVATLDIRADAHFDAVAYAAKVLGGEPQTMRGAPLPEKAIAMVELMWKGSDAGQAPGRRLCSRMFAGVKRGVAQWTEWRPT